MNSRRVAMEIPLNSKHAGEPDAVQRAAIMLELTRNQEREAMGKVLTEINETSKGRGEQIISYLDHAKTWVKDMKEIAGT